MWCKAHASFQVFFGTEHKIALGIVYENCSCFVLCESCQKLLIIYRSYYKRIREIDSWAKNAKTCSFHSQRKKRQS